MKDYVDARREFWERVFCATIQIAAIAGKSNGPQKMADWAVEQEWDERYKCGPNGKVVPRDTDDGTYNASEAGAT